MERLSFKQFISNNLFEAKGWFGNFGTVSALTAALIGSGRTPGSTVKEREKTNIIYSEALPHKKMKYNFEDNYADTIQSLRQQRVIPPSRDVQGLVDKNRESASIPFSVKIGNARRRLEEARKSRFRNPLYVFDFDDTIAKSNDSRVKVIDNRTGSWKHISSSGFATYKPEPHERMDFSEFNRVTNPQRIKPIHKILRNMKRAGRNFMVLTARSKEAEPAIIDYLKQQGLHHDGVKVVGLGTSESKAKADYLREILRQNDHDHLMFVDDAGSNVEHVSGLSREFPNINIRARKINYGDH